LQGRIRNEVKAKDTKAKSYFEKVERGEWTPQQFADMLAILNTITLTEKGKVVGQREDGTDIVEAASVEEAARDLEEYERAITEGSRPARYHTAALSGLRFRL